MPRTLGYRRILVPISASAESEKAMDVACRLAAERGASITVVTVVEIPSLLPLDAHMVNEEARAHALLERAAAIADSYGVGISQRILRAREAAHAIVREAQTARAEILVIGAPRKDGARAWTGVFGTTVEHVLKRAPCRVIVIGTPLSAVATVQNAAA